MAVGVSLFRELTWVLPFAGLLLISLALLRPWPETSISFPGEVATIVDGRGKPVTVPAVPQSVVSNATGFYLMSTHAPRLLSSLGEKRWRAWFKDQVPAWIYPELLEDRYWQGAFNLETLLRDRPEQIYFGSIWIAGDVYDSDDLRRLGIIGVATMPDNLPQDQFAALLAKLGLTEEEYDEQYRMFAAVRVMNAALNQPQFAEQVIARFKRERDAVLAELRSESIAEQDRPYVVGMGAPADDWSRIWVNSDDNPRLASRGVAKFKAKGREQDAERVLMMNPDVIFGPTLREFGDDPRWRGLDAVRNRRVYADYPPFCGYRHNPDNQPACLRSQAEILHPDRLAPKTRQAIRDHYRQSYGFEMSEEQIDILLKVEENAASLGYERFTRAASDTPGGRP
jgi:ABC-type Fe3+-hydroxamate transport system substrate-binding protein